MSIIDKIKALPASLFILHFISKVIIGFGLGIVAARCMQGLGWWIVGLGIVLSVPAIVKIWSKQACGSYNLK
jgi:hypothetical protein